MEDQKLLFIEKLKAAVILACNVKNTTPADIDSLEPIIGGKGKLQLDSLDALEIIMMIEQNFGIRLSGDENSRALFQSFDKMATHILEHAPQDKIKEFLSQK